MHLGYIGGGIWVTPVNRFAAVETYALPAWSLVYVTPTLPYSTSLCCTLLHSTYSTLLYSTVFNSTLLFYCSRVYFTLRRPQACPTLILLYATPTPTPGGPKVGSRSTLGNTRDFILRTFEYDPGGIQKPTVESKVKRIFCECKQ